MNLVVQSYVEQAEWDHDLDQILVCDVIEIFTVFEHSPYDDGFFYRVWEGPRREETEDDELPEPDDWNGKFSGKGR